MNSPAVTLLIQHYLDWQKELGQVKSMKDFAAYLELHEGTVNRIMNGKQVISKGVAVHLAQKLKDSRFYATLDKQVERWPELLVESDPQQMNAILHMFLDKIVVTGDQVELVYHDWW